MSECSICYDAITQETGVTTLSCSHSYHLKCIAQWIIKHDHCPCCRKETSEYEKIHDINNTDEDFTLLNEFANTTVEFEWYTATPELRLPPDIIRNALMLVDPEMVMLNDSIHSVNVNTTIYNTPDRMN